MRFVSLFAGVGGFDLGLELAGHECIAQVEIDKHCRTVLDKHWPDVPKHDDVRSAIEFADRVGLVGRTDLVCGGFPCQDVSVAGKRAGLAGERTGLFWDALAFTTHVEARWLLLENVPGLLTSNQGRDFGTVVAALADAGLPHIEWRVLDSQFFGVPQRRRRVFLVAGTERHSRQPLLAESEGSEWDLRTLPSQRDVFAPISSSGISVWTKSRRAMSTTDHETWVPGVVSPTLNAFDNATETRATVLVVKDEKARRMTPIECERLQGFPDDWTAGVADSNRYKQMGNAVTVNVAHFIGAMLT